MITKHDEEVLKTSSIPLMEGKYLVKRLLRTWNENFVDEDTGEVVSIERNEIVLQKGTLIDADAMDTINFHFQSEGIEEIAVSNHQRDCMRINRGANLWKVGIELNSKKKTIYLYATSVESAVDIATDYIEQKYSGQFNFKSLTELDYSNLMIDEDLDEEGIDKDLAVYTVDIEFTDEDGTNRNSFILKGEDVEDCKFKIKEYLTFMRVKEERSTDFELKILSAKTISVHFIVDPEFSKRYFEMEKIKHQDPIIDSTEEE